MTLTTAAQNLDPGHASFMAMLYLDYVYNSPITSVLAANLANAMRTRRIKNEMKQDDQRPETQVPPPRMHPGVTTMPGMALLCPARLH